MDWDVIKEVFFTAGSVAGSLAFFKTLFDDKLQRDKVRIEYVRNLLPEQQILDLEGWIWSSRRVPDDTLVRLLRLSREVANEQDCVRFSGPSSKWLRASVRDITGAHDALRELIQVPWWEPSEDRHGDQEWVFNKSAFETEDGEPGPYDRHLDQAAECARQVALAYQRFQIVSELHLYELPFARILLRRRIGAHRKGV